MEVGVEISSQVYRVKQGKNSRVFSISEQDDVEGWGMIIFSLVVGLLALGFFLALGGMFALIGPWMVFAAAHLVRQKWARKAGKQLRQRAIELVASIRNHIPSRSVGEPWGWSSNGFANGKATSVCLTDDFLAQSLVVV